MLYKEFLNYAEKELSEKLKTRGLKVRLSSIVKSADNKRDCILISEDDAECAPAIYLDDFYRLYENGKDLEEITEMIIRVYDENCHLLPMDKTLLWDWDKVKDNITCRLMNANVNRQYLEDAVHIEYLDLAIVFYNSIITEEKHIFSCKINEEMMKEWRLDTEQLYRIAMDNTKRLFGIHLQEIEEVFLEIMEKNDAADDEMSEVLNDTERVPMYILTNNISSLGAVNIFMDDVLKALSQTLDDDLYIIPSSIHEVIIIPVKSRIKEEKINCMIREINMNLLEPQDILSNHVYRYSRESEKIV